MKKIVHFGGMDSYDGHESGNYIVFKQFRDLTYDSTHILGVTKMWNDEDTFYIPLTRPEDQIELEDKIDNIDVVIIYDSMLTPETLRRIYDKHKCPII